MDNLEQETNPSGEADVTASQGQFEAPETQPVETELAVDGGESAETGEASNPWEQDPRFVGKGPEDIYNAYTNLERKLGDWKKTSERAEVASLIEQKYGLTPEQFRSVIEEQERQQMQQRYANNPLAPIVDEVQQLKQYIANQEAKTALAEEERKLDEFLSENPGYKEHRDKILNIGLNIERDKSFQEIAQEWFGQARAQGQQDAYKKIELKKNTRATGVSQVPPKGKITPEDMANMSAAELEAILPHADISGRPF